MEGAVRRMHQRRQGAAMPGGGPPGGRTRWAWWAQWSRRLQRLPWGAGSGPGSRWRCAAGQTGAVTEELGFGSQPSRQVWRGAQLRLAWGAGGRCWGRSPRCWVRILQDSSCSAEHCWPRASWAPLSEAWSLVLSPERAESETRG